MYGHSTPLECGALKQRFSIDILPLRGREKAEKTFLKCAKPVSSNLGYGPALMNYTIAEASIDNVEAIVDVTFQSFEDAFNKPFYMEREAAVHRWRAYMRKEHHPRDAKDPRIVYIVSTNGEIVGFVAGHLTERLGLEGELQSIYVLPKHQGRGLGTQLVIALAQWFKKWNAKEVCVDHKDGSEGFYIKLGAKFNDHGWLVWDNFFDVLAFEKSERNRV